MVDRWRGGERQLTHDPCRPSTGSWGRAAAGPGCAACSSPPVSAPANGPFALW